MTQSYFLPLKRRRVLAGRPAEYDRIGQRVAAQTVASVDASGYFSGCIQTRDHIAFGIDHFGIHVDLHAAHGVVHGGNPRRRIVRSVVDAVVLLGRIGEQSPAEFIRLSL